MTVLSRELGPTGFSFAITAAIGGGSMLQLAWKNLEEGNIPFEPRLGERGKEFRRWMVQVPPERRAFVLNAFTSFVGILLMQSRRKSSYTHQAPIPWTPPITPPSENSQGRTSPTLDLTLLFVVRAIDALVQGALAKYQGTKSEEAEERHRKVTAVLDTFVFWVSSAR